MKKGSEIVVKIEKTEYMEKILFQVKLEKEESRKKRLTMQK